MSRAVVVKDVVAARESAARHRLCETRFPPMMKRRDAFDFTATDDTVSRAAR